MISSLSVIYPPRPKGKIAPNDLSFYEKTNDWIVQRKFNGSRAIVYISESREVSLFSRHGRPFFNFDLDISIKKELLEVLDLDDGKDYWLDGELMNKGKNPSNEIIFFDILHAGRYLFYKPSQEERLELLNNVCRSPKILCESNLSLKMSSRFYMAENFKSCFKEKFQECLSNPKIEGLVLRKRKFGLDNLGTKEYETKNLIRCRKPFSKLKGYEF